MVQFVKEPPIPSRSPATGRIAIGSMKERPTRWSTPKILSFMFPSPFPYFYAAVPGSRECPLVDSCFFDKSIVDFRLFVNSLTMAGFHRTITKTPVADEVFSFVFCLLCGTRYAIIKLSTSTEGGRPDLRRHAPAFRHSDCVLRGSGQTTNRDSWIHQREERFKWISRL